MREEYLYAYQENALTLHLWRDLEKSRKEWQTLSPEDVNEINTFLDAVNRSECIHPPINKSLAHMNVFEYVTFILKLKPMSKVNKEYANETIASFVERFQNPKLKKLFLSYFPSNYPVILLITTYGFFSSNSAAIPLAGSIGMVNEIVENYESNFGELHYNKKVTQMYIQNNTLEYIELEDGEKVYADAFIWAADPSILFHNLLADNHTPKELVMMYKNPENYVANSGFQVAFGIKNLPNDAIPEGTIVFPCEPYEISGHTLDTCSVRFYTYDAFIFPKGNYVVQSNILLNTNDFHNWESLAQDEEEYKKTKNRIAQDIQERIVHQFPQFRDNLIVLSTYSPLSFQHWCGAYKGAYMSFNNLNGSKSIHLKNTIDGVENLFLASQWTMNGGGLPIAALSGKFAVQALSKKFKLK